MIDLDGGLVLVGPESEWFWTAFSGILVGISLLAVFRQLRLQTSQKMRDDIANLEAEYNSERFLRYRLQLATARRDGLAPEQMPDAACRSIVNFWDEVGEFARARHIDRKMTASMMGGAAVSGWFHLEPWIRHQGMASGHEGGYGWFVQECVRLEPDAAPMLEPPPPEYYDSWVAYLEDLITVEVALRH